jgi:hypothetical protein
MTSDDIFMVVCIVGAIWFAYGIVCFVRECNR